MDAQRFDNIRWNVFIWVSIGGMLVRMVVGWCHDGTGRRGSARR